MPVRSARERLVDGLANTRCLLVVDDCEHVIEAAAGVVADVLARCPGVTVLATSREPLGTDGEVLYPLSPLAVPPAGADEETAVASPAVRLLLEHALAAGTRARARCRHGRPRRGGRRRLDGLPLAIELAAALGRSGEGGGAPGGE